MARMEAVWPTNRAPAKAEIERLYRVAYMIDPAIFSPEDAVGFGLDVRRLKEFGQVRMSKPLAQLRKRLPEFWERLDRQLRAVFLVSYLMEGVCWMSAVVSDLERELDDLKEVREALEWIKSSLFSRFPKDLEARLRDGLGKWGNGRL